METVSWLVLAMIASTFVMLALRRNNMTAILAFSNIAVSAAALIGYHGSFNITLFELGLKTAYLFELKEPWTLVTSMFLHADIFHLLFNILFLMAIGIPLESRIGKWRFLTIYLVGGIAGSMMFALIEWNTSVNIILVGASGAISALMGAMLILYPRERIMFFLGPLLTDRFSVYVPIMVWFGLQILLFSFDDSPVAYAAHLGGFVAGAGIAWAVRPRTDAAQQRMRMCDISPLRALCTTSSLREMYDYAENARDDETREIWTERMLEDVRCPVCGAEIKRRRNGFECTNGHTL